MEYKSHPSLTSKAGTKVVTSKKDFCRLLKGAHLLTAGKKSPAINEADVDAVARVIWPLATSEPNHYATLGLDRRCTLAQIRAAYRLLAKQHHPDVNPDSPAAVARTQELNAAYETLKRSGASGSLRPRT